MSKKISDIERVTTYFQTAGEADVTFMLQAVKGIVAGRNFAKPEKPEKKKREPAKAPRSLAGVPPAPSVEKATVANSNGNAKLNGTDGLNEAMRRSLNAGNDRNAGLN